MGVVRRKLAQLLLWLLLDDTADPAAPAKSGVSTRCRNAVAWWLSADPLPRIPLRRQTNRGSVKNGFRNEAQLSYSSPVRVSPIQPTDSTLSAVSLLLFDRIKSVGWQLFPLLS